MVLLVLFYVVRRIVYSPFGEALAGIRENVDRMHAIGSPVRWRLVVVYTIAAAIAGVAGALFTQTNAVRDARRVRLRHRAGVMVMLILGGTGRLYGAFVGGVIYMVLQDYLSKASPRILAVRRRASAGAGRAVRAPRPARPVRGPRRHACGGSAAMTAALEIRGLHKNFGALAVTRDINLDIASAARATR